MLEELFTSLREFEELEAIHEEEEDSGSGTDLRDELDPIVPLQDDDDTFTSLRVLEELFTSLREFEELEAIHEELEDSGSGTDLRDELLLDESTPLRSEDDDDTIELDRFSDHASDALEESSPQAITKINELRSKR